MIKFNIEDSFFITGRGTVYTGRIKGNYAENEVLGSNIVINQVEYKIIGVERFCKYIGHAYQFDEPIGLLVKLNIQDANFIYYPNFVKDASLFYYLLNNIAWQDEFVVMRGNVYPVTRKSALFGDYDYMYGGIMHSPQPANEEINKLLAEVNKACQIDFNSILLNLYPDGKSALGFHADDEKGLGDNPRVASISLGAERWFHIKNKKTSEVHKILLENGSLLIMGKDSQTNYLHALPKGDKMCRERINITFRKFYD